MSGDILTVLIAMLGGAIRVSTPFMFVALGECLTEKSGRVNLGLEGTLVLGAMVAYAFTRVVSTPLDNQDVGNWACTLGMAALFLEAALMALSAYAIASRQHARQVLLAVRGNTTNRYRGE